MSKPSILIIEGDLPTLELYRGILQEGYEVLSYSNKSGILDFLKKHTVHAIILEPAIEHGIGWKIFATINTITRENPIPIVICTTSDERKRGLEMGAAAFLIKPVLPTLLLQTLSQLQHDHPGN